nr:MAG TPA: hypothetical protein [Caudoviricetes sp.]
MKKIFGLLKETVLLIFGLDCETRSQAVDGGFCDYSGQGRDKYGR